MDLRELFRITLRWLWLLILGAILGGVSTYFFSIYQQPVYASTAQVFITQPQRNQLADLGYYNGQQLIQTYIELMVTDQVLSETAQRVDHIVRENQISIQQVRDTQVIKVTVEDSNPSKAAEFANMLVIVFLSLIHI